MSSDDLDEKWLPVIDYEGVYEVSNLGNVRSTPRPRTKGGVLKSSAHTDGYRQVTLTLGGRKRKVFVHRLVAEAFHGQPPAGKPFALHGDGNPANNRVDNLRWGSQVENIADSVRHGTKPPSAMAARTHCPQGHAYDEQNTRVTNGKRNCRACGRMRQATYYRRKTNV